ncbi:MULTISPECIES: DUF5103 domain-containing protein [Myroides]|uniref:DUF5103 domain-containing protein n=1 Tax=Myroides albus TaxID=2562892 RepID=A0A6I3LL94_9FLAO|nr:MULTISPECIES: DUF5103 domain-containing protein [Myroides]MTG96942.1 DUF5103 domain-containing protein [Myroides albus]MVX35365.1 DUF5103 domain-containing protein [Myroides sp. LoEW2-1]UVD78307.1 DUF5103 domain-containing protein [Myroides albus]
MLSKISILLCTLFTVVSMGQVPQNITVDYIKSASFMRGNQSTFPHFRLGESFTLEFDDLYGDESNYYYRVKAYNYDWTPSKLRTIEYIDGMDNQRIRSYENSFNTLQDYTHYSLTLPNSQYKITKSGNYALEIYDDQNEVVIRRKFVLYEDNAKVSLQVKRTRNLDFYDSKQRLEFSVPMGEAEYQNPMKNIKVAIFQNGRWDSFLHNIAPQYIIGTDLVYKYDEETQFWGGNQYLNFDNSDIRQVNNMIGATNVTNGIYNTYLHINESRRAKVYTYFPDLNGHFYPRMINQYKKVSTEGEYSWVYFSYSPELDMPENTDYYVTGMFNDYELTSSNKLVYNEEKDVYEKAILIKQGFTNFNYTATVDRKVAPEWNADGNFALTTNTYQVIVYYRGSIDLYDRAIGYGFINAQDITN